MATVYEIARVLKMPGMVVEAHLDPTQLTKRVFNAARKMIASGIVVGHGASAGVARSLFRNHKLSYVAINKWGVYRHGYVQLTQEAKDELVGIYEAYIAIKRMNDVHHGGYWSDRVKDFERWMHDIETNEALRTYLSLNNIVYAEQFGTLLASCHAPDQIEGRRELLTKFELGTRFHFDVVNWDQYYN